MIITEVRAKELLRNAGVHVPRGIVARTAAEAVNAVLGEERISWPVMIKAQVLHGNRAQQGLVMQANSDQELRSGVEQILSLSDQFGQKIQEVLIEEVAQFVSEHYLALSYDTSARRLVVRYSAAGGSGMDERGNTLETVAVSVLQQPTVFEPEPALVPVVQQLWSTFLENDATLLEINPLVKTEHGWLCLDAKIELEESAAFRHPEWEAVKARPAAAGREGSPSRAEQAQSVSRSDHRGVAGESFFEFPGGTIGVMASGGGASTIAMDALLAEGMSPANYTEYSGNPSRDKVRGLAAVVLSIPNLQALYVVGSNANFTDIYETLAGVVDGLLASPYVRQQDFSVLIRRGGPRWQEAFEMVRERLSETSIRLKLCGPDFPLVETAAALKVLMEQETAKER